MGSIVPEGGISVDLRTWLGTDGADRLLITDNIKNGNALIMRLNRAGQPVTGLTVTTPERVAKELLIRELAARGKAEAVRELDGGAGAFIVERILRSDPEHYSFVPRESLCTAAAAEVLRILDLIRENRVSDSFLNASGKPARLRGLVSAYEQRLSALGLYDRAALLRAGIHALRGGIRCGEKNTAFLFTEKPSVLLSEFLGLLAPDAPELTLEPPQREAEWHFFEAYGIWNEAEYILEDIRRRKLPFGQVCVLYTSPDYEPVLSGAFGERRIPLCFPDGRSAACSDSIQMLLALIRWAAGGYRYEDLKAVVLNPLFRIPCAEGARVKGLEEFLQGAADGIGWGLDRYERFLEAPRSRKPHSEEFLSFLSDAAGVFGGDADLRDTAALFGRMAGFVKKYSRGAEEHQYVYPALDREVRRLSLRLPAESVRESLELLEDRLRSLALVTGENASSVSACCLSGVRLPDRPYLYVIGLSDRQYSESPAESPVLNDEELALYFDRTAGNVPLAEEQPAKRMEYYIRSLTLSDSREIHAGRCSFDTVRQEALSPSALFLNLREQHGGPEKLPLTGYPRVLRKDAIVSASALWPAKAAAPEAPQAAGSEFSAVFSPSALDDFLACPARYYFQRKRYIPQEDYTRRETGVWLPANERGTYFHLLMQKYCERCLIGREQIPAEPDPELFREAFAAATEETLARVPVDAPAAALQEQQEIHDAALRCLRELHLELSDPACPWRVLACEKSFGLNDEPGLELDHSFTPGEDGGSPETYHITFCGTIDRLDGYTDSEGHTHLRITDYKTGTNKSFQDYHMGKKSGHKTVQHNIYRLYASSLGEVEEFRYLFPFEEKAEDRILRITDFKDPVDETVLRLLHESFALGAYPADPEGGGCSFCRYADICPARL